MFVSALILRAALTHTVLLAVVCASVVPALDVERNCAAHQQPAFGKLPSAAKPCCCSKGEQRPCACKPQEDSSRQPLPISDEVRVTKAEPWANADFVSYLGETPERSAISHQPVLAIASSRSTQSLLCVWRI